VLTIPSVSFSPQVRQDLLAELDRLRAELDELRPRLDADEDNDDLLLAEDALIDQLLELRLHYADGLPVADLSRCPFSGLRFGYPLDSFGLDGPWWDYGDPVRPDYPLPASVYAITGAVALNGAPEPASFVASPGPVVPYVIPRLLDLDGSVAVLSSLPIGPHAAYAIIYYSHPAAPGRPVVNEWASNRWYFNSLVDEPGWDSQPLLAEQLDFNLEPWLAGERLLWIAPGDPNLVPHKGVEGCPYLDLVGTTEPQWLYEGGVS
jgi:hypothetical protein